MSLPYSGALFWLFGQVNAPSLPTCTNLLRAFRRDAEWGRNHFRIAVNSLSSICRIPNKSAWDAWGAMGISWPSREF